MSLPLKADEVSSFLANHSPERWESLWSELALSKKKFHWKTFFEVLDVIQRAIEKLPVEEQMRYESSIQSFWRKGAEHLSGWKMKTPSNEKPFYTWNRHSSCGVAPVAYSEFLLALKPHLDDARCIANDFLKSDPVFHAMLQEAYRWNKPYYDPKGPLWINAYYQHTFEPSVLNKIQARQTFKTELSHPDDYLYALSMLRFDKKGLFPYLVENFSVGPTKGHITANSRGYFNNILFGLYERDETLAQKWPRLQYFIEQGMQYFLHPQRDVKHYFDERTFFKSIYDVMVPSYGKVIHSAEELKAFFAEHPALALYQKILIGGASCQYRQRDDEVFNRLASYWTGTLQWSDIHQLLEQTAPSWEMKIANLIDPKGVSVFKSIVGDDDWLEQWKQSGAPPIDAPSTSIDFNLLS